MRINLSIAGVLLATTLTFLVAPQSGHSQPDAADPAESSEEGFEDEGESGDATTDTAAPADAPAAETDSLDSLRDEYFKLRDRLFQSRARASAVSSALYSTRLSVRLGYDSARYYTVTRATIRLDGANIYDDSEGSIASDKSPPRFEGFIAPGRHQLSIRIEASGKDDDRFTSVVENSFTVQAVKGEDLEIKATAKDEGDIAYRWAKKKRGSYKLHLDVGLKSVKRKSKGKNKKAAAVTTPLGKATRG